MARTAPRGAGREQALAVGDAEEEPRASRRGRRARPTSRPAALHASEPRGSQWPQPPATARAETAGGAPTAAAARRATATPSDRAPSRRRRPSPPKPPNDGRVTATVRARRRSGGRDRRRRGCVWWAGASRAAVAGIVARIRDIGPAAPIAFIVIYAAAVVALIPASMLTIAAGRGVRPRARRALRVRRRRRSARPPRFCSAVTCCAARRAAAGDDAAIRGDRAGGQRAGPPHRVPAAAVAGRPIQFSELRAGADHDLGWRTSSSRRSG